MAESIPREYKTVPIDSIQSHPHNPRRGDIGFIERSINANGFYGEIRVQKSTGYIITGNHSWQAAKKAGLKEIPVSILDVDDDRAVAILLADNRTSDLATYNETELDALLKSLPDQIKLDSMFDLELIFPDTDKYKTDVEAVPELADEAVTTDGQIWQCGQHRLLCGDATDPKNIAKVLDGVKADTLVYDPPFELTDLYGYILPASEIKRLMLFYDYRRFANAIIAATDKGWKPQYELIWDKVIATPAAHRPMPCHKVCSIFCEDPLFDHKKAKIEGVNSLSLYKSDCSIIDIGLEDDAEYLRTVYRLRGQRKSPLHKHAKPVRWLQSILAGIGAENVLSLFGGSGADMIAADHLGIPCYMIEMDPKYCDQIVNRWQEHTGKKAT